MNLRGPEISWKRDEGVASPECSLHHRAILSVNYAS
jgi:hypothetical protein